MVTSVWVLMKRTDEAEGTDKVHAIYETRDACFARAERILARNSQYPSRRINETTWRLGPEEDEGFFGAKPLWISIEEHEVKR